MIIYRNAEFNKDTDVSIVEVGQIASDLLEMLSNRDCLERIPPMVLPAVLNDFKVCLGHLNVRSVIVKAKGPSTFFDCDYRQLSFEEKISYLDDTIMVIKVLVHEFPCRLIGNIDWWINAQEYLDKFLRSDEEHEDARIEEIISVGIWCFDLDEEIFLTDLNNRMLEQINKYFALQGIS